MNPNRVATTYRVEYGTTVAYGSQTSAVSAGSGSSAVAVSVPLSGLTSSTTHHARLVADSAAGTTYGPDLTFTTADLPPSVTGTAAGSVTTSGATHLRRREPQPGRDDVSRRVRGDGRVRVADTGGVGGVRLVGGRGERAARRA